MSCVSSESSGLKSADAAISSAPCFLTGISLLPAAADSTIVLYDNASAASGTVLWKMTALANAKSEHIAFPVPIYANNGIYADISGASANYIVTFSAS